MITTLFQRRWISLAVVLAPLGLALAPISGCTEEAPLKVGFVAGLTGKVADLGQSCKQGAILAVDMRNEKGGIGGRKIVLSVADDKQEPEVAAKAVRDLLAEGVVGIIGHMTSAMSMRGVPIINEAETVMVSPTTTTTELSDKDDYFFRVIESTLEYSHNMASFLFNNKGFRTAVLSYDISNRAYTETWADNFKEGFEKLGGEVLLKQPYSSKEEASFYDLAKLLDGKGPDVIISVASATDTAMLCQQLKKLGSGSLVAASEWSATEQLIDIGGEAVEGAIVSQYFNRDATNPEYVGFRNRYKKRFKVEPGFASVAAYDAANLLFDAMADRREGETIKEAILRIRTFRGVQSPIEIDEHGDAKRPAMLVQVKQGTFRIIN